MRKHRNNAIHCVFVGEERDKRNPLSRYPVDAKADARCYTEQAETISARGSGHVRARANNSSRVLTPYSGLRNQSKILPTSVWSIPL